GPCCQCVVPLFGRGGVGGGGTATAAARQRRAHVVGGDGVGHGQRGQPPADVFQFAHVAGPVVLAQRLHGSGGQVLARHVEPAGGTGQEGGGQLRHVVDAFAQRRQPQPHHVQPVQQV